MIVERIVVGPLEENCYLVGCEKTKEAVVIDPGEYPSKILKAAKLKGLKIKFILLTHCHFDHVGAVAKIKEAANAKVFLHKDEEELLKSSVQQALMFGLKLDSPPSEYEFISDGDEIIFGEGKLKVIYTPGHTAGHVSFYYNSKEERGVFSGDVIFKGSIGRTDLPGGDYETLMNSINEKIVPLGDNVVIFSGHGPETTVGKEKKYNPFLKGGFF